MANIQCPVCAAEGNGAVATKVDSNERKRQPVAEVYRKRYCPKGHSFGTVEFVEGHALLVRRGRSGTTEEFNPKRPSQTIQRATYGLIDPDTVIQILIQIEANLRPKTVDDRFLLGVISNRLDLVHELASPAYNLFVQGDVAGLGLGREGVMLCAEGFLNWEQNPSTLVPEELSPERFARINERNLQTLEQLVKSLPCEPDTSPPVIKRNGSEVAFERDRLQAAFSHVFVGRPEHNRMVDVAVSLTTAAIADHGVVTTPQISGAATNVIRRVDDIAYLRWAIPAKSLRSRRQLRLEAEALRQRSTRAMPFPLVNDSGGAI